MIRAFGSLSALVFPPAGSAALTFVSVNLSFVLTQWLPFSEMGRNLPLITQGPCQDRTYAAVWFLPSPSLPRTAAVLAFCGLSLMPQFYIKLFRL